MADLDLDLDAIFPEPPRPPSPEATTVTYERIPRKALALTDSSHSTTDKITLTLVGNHPLWGHYLWNAAKCLASYLDEHPSLYRGGNVLELGAGGALPSIITAKNSASKVVITDYPDQELTTNISKNVRQNIDDDSILGNVHVQGYIWGRPVRPLLDFLGLESDSSKFDLIILSDLIFNHSQHGALLQTCEQTCATNGLVLVFYTHHRPHLAHRDMAFFELAKERGWKCEEIVTETFEPMFPEDPGEEEVRATVHGWKLTRSSE